jgi:hypothetical protein
MYEYFHEFLSWALNEMSGHFHALAVLPPRKEPSSTQWICGWVGSRTDLDYVEEVIKILLVELKIIINMD